MGNFSDDEFGTVETDADGGLEQLRDIWCQSDNETREQALRLLTHMAYNHIVSHIKKNDDPVDRE